MAHPGSLRDSSVSLENRAATSASRPAFAIQVTASTTILDPLLSLGFCPRLAVLHRLQFGEELVNKNGFFAAWPCGNHADARASFSRNEFEILAGDLRQLAVLGNALCRRIPA